MEERGYRQDDAEQLVGQTVLARRHFGSVPPGTVGLIIGAEPFTGPNDWQVVIRWGTDGPVDAFDREDVETGLLTQTACDPHLTDRQVIEWRSLRSVVGRLLYIPEAPVTGGDMGVGVTVSFAGPRRCWCLVAEFETGRQQLSLWELARGRVQLVSP